MGTQSMPDTMTEAGTRLWDDTTVLRERLEIGIERDLAEGYDHLHAPEHLDLTNQIRLAMIVLRAFRFIAGRGTPNCRRNIAIGELQAVVSVH